MRITLDQAGSFLQMQTPKEYVQQVAAASEGLRRAKLMKVKQTGTDGSLLDQLRGLLEGKGEGTDG